jgi:hypothetical protein
MSGVMINGSLGYQIVQRIDSRNVFEWNSPKWEFDRTRITITSAKGRDI